MHKFKLILKILASITVILVVIVVVIIYSSKPQYSGEIKLGSTLDDVEVIYDEFGVPHIYAKRDAEVAYGLAWANAEDMFDVMQETFLTGKGLLGRYQGKEGAAADFLRHLLRFDVMVEEHFNELSLPFKKYLDGYVQGFNAYAAAHPKEVIIKKLLPVTSKDVLETYALVAGFLSSVHTHVEEIAKGELAQKKVSMGSNAFALNASRTANGKTFLAINPHQPMEGPFSFYEAHLVSEEGLNITGSLFPGGTSIFMGNNENLGWGMTFNGLDLVDVYELKMHPENKLRYEFDGEYYDLEERPVKLKVKIMGVVIGVKKTTYWSKYGATMENDGRFYSIRLGANMGVRMAEQWYFMDKANNLAEFRGALGIQGIPRFNIVYADKEDNIFYFNNGLIPIRADGYDWDKTLPGNTSKTLWTEFYSAADMPQLLNPSCGFVVNTNNTPFHCTCAKDDMDIDDTLRYPMNMGHTRADNNRSLRFHELISEKDKYTVDELRAIKYDSKYPKTSKFQEDMALLFNLDPKKYPELATIINELHNWDREVKDESVASTYLLISMDYIFNKYNFGYPNFMYGLDITEEQLVEGLVYAKEHLLKYFGKLDVPVRELKRLRRGDVDLTCPGFSELLAAAYFNKEKDGRYKVFVGDSYTHFVEFDKDGPQSIETCLPYGSSARKDSPHYTDQMKLYSTHQTKSMTLDRKVVEKNAERTYHPKR